MNITKALNRIIAGTLARPLESWRRRNPDYNGNALLWLLFRRRKASIPFETPVKVCGKIVRRPFLNLVLSSFGVATFIGLGAWLTAGEDNNPDQLRAEARKLVAKAEDLKAEGQGEEATKLVREAEDLRREADERQREGQPPPGPQPKEQLRDLKRDLNQLRGEIKELVAAGRMEEAGKAKQRLAELERRPDRESEARILSRKKELRQNRTGEPSEPREPKREMQPRRMEPGAPEQRDAFRQIERQESRPIEMDQEQSRWHHLRVAIENLHLAGLHETAENLEREARMREGSFDSRQGLVPPRGPVPPRNSGSDRDVRPPRNPVPQAREPSPAGVGELREELNELRRVVMELRRRVEDLSQERR